MFIRSDPSRPGLLSTVVGGFLRDDRSVQVKAESILTDNEFETTEHFPVQSALCIHYYILVAFVFEPGGGGTRAVAVHGRA